VTRRKVAEKVITAPETAYRLDGAVDAPVLLLSNGLAADLSMWDAQIPFLAAHYRTLRYDNRGHGDTPASPGPYSIDLLASDVVDLLDHLAIRQVHFVGMSLGGTVGWMLAASYPERIRSLMLCDTPIEAAPEVWATRITTALARGMEPLVEPTLERWLTASFRATSPVVTEQVRRMIRRTSPVGYAGCAAAIQSMRLTALLPHIKAPTLVIVGEEDAATPPAMAERLAASIPGAELVVIKGAAHLPNIEQPEAFNAAIGDFLRRHAGVSPLDEPRGRG
jgi:3-oxoadipate enol-lactonase